MTKIIFDVPAESGGALSILDNYYKKCVQDKNRNFIFILSTPLYEDTENVTILNYPWIKRSWFHRLFFDFFISKKIIKKYKPNEIFSLQNTRIPVTRKIRQGIYVHQPLPFVNKKYSFTENKLFWIYQNIISILIFNSIKKADYVIVQTNWMRESILKKINLKNESKIRVEKPDITIPNCEFKNTEKSFETFFYPASSVEYKNHFVIARAVKLLVERQVDAIDVVFTLDELDTNIIDLVTFIEENKLPIRLIGNIDRETVYKFYETSVLIFPSKIETFGLPLLEARLIGSPILAIRESFSEEILENYKNHYFFEGDDYKTLANMMESSIKNGIVFFNFKKEKM